MKKNMLSRVLTLALAALLALSLFACGKKSDDNSTGSSGAASYQVGICSYADDASLNQIVDNIESRLKAIGQEKGVTFEISYHRQLHGRQGGPDDRRSHSRGRGHAGRHRGH